MPPAVRLVRCETHGSSSRVGFRKHFPLRLMPPVAEQRDWIMRRLPSFHAALKLALACTLLAMAPCAFALDPTLDVSQYAHTSWKIRDGFSKGAIASIAQTPDGYLWFGTEFGLLRFDGVKNAPWQPPKQQLPSNYIFSLLATHDGALWIGTTKGLASWKDGKLTLYAEMAGQNIFKILEDHEG